MPLKGNRPVWDLVKTNSGRQCIVTSALNIEAVEKMEKYGPILVSMGAIPRSTPYLVTKYAVETLMAAIEKQLEGK